jgi:hypothetical protein
LPAEKVRSAAQPATVSCMLKKILFVALIVGVGFLAAKKLRAA